ncbi:MAG TPA: ATP-binding cassette domain-containing protein, partial [Ottowia sp.]
TNLFGQAAVVFPFIVAAPRFFSGAIQLGQLMQIGSAFDRVQGALSWFVDNYDSLAAWRATTERLTSFEAALSKQNQPPALDRQAQAAINSEAIELNDLTLQLPTGATLLQGATARVAPGEHTLLQGPSGSGKSTLLRALAGIWPWARGRTGLPAGAMFIPQRPYFPDGSLRDALAYPEPAAAYSDEQLKTALQDALLPALAERLDERDNWTQKLSGGEQQRLAIARVLLKQPAWVLADEATSALDVPAEQTLYEKLRALTEQRGGALLSIAHRPSVAAFHERSWRFVPQAAGSAARFGLESGAA